MCSLPQGPLRKKKKITMSNLHVDLILVLVVATIFFSRKIIDQPNFSKLLKGSRNIPYTNRNVARYKLLKGSEISVENKSKLGTLYMHRDGFRYEVVLTTPDQLKQYFSSHPRDHAKLDSFGAGQYLVALLGECLGFQNGDLWMNMRKLFNGYFSHALAIQTLPTMVEFIGGYVESTTKESSKVVDPFEYVSAIPFTCIANYLYGKSHCTPERLSGLKELIPLHTDLLTFAFKTFWGRFKIFQFFQSDEMKGLRHFQDRFTQLSLEMVRNAGNDPSVASELYSRVEQGELSFDSWIQTLDEILFANIDVTATVMSWALVEMARNPNAQHAVREEIHSSTELQEEYVKKTETHLHRVLLETLRLHPLLWFGFPEVVSKDIVIDGFQIPAHTPIVIDQFQVNYESEIWNPPNKPKGFGHEFHPDRFIGLGNRDVLMSSVTFGSGPRRCLGKNFAEIVVKTLLVNMVKHFELLLCDPVEYAENTFVVQPKTKVKLGRIGV